MKLHCIGDPFRSCVEKTDTHSDRDTSCYFYKKKSTKMKAHPKSKFRGKKLLCDFLRIILNNLMSNELYIVFSFIHPSEDAIVQVFFFIFKFFLFGLRT